MLTRHQPDLRVLFATNFSTACERATRGIAQLADALQLDVTIVHAVKAGAGRPEVRRALDGFFPEAQRLFRCRRVAIEGADAAVAVAALCNQVGYDLIVAPGSGRFGWSNLMGGSFRARLLAHARVPVWTAGSCLPAIDFSRPIGSVACLVDFDDQPESFLPQVTAFAQHFGARVQALAVLPAVDDGVIGEVAQSNTPLLPEHAAARIAEMFGGDAPASIDVGVGRRGRELARLLAHRKADLLFVGPRQAAARSWPRTVSRDLDRLPCPVVCVGNLAGLAGRAFHRAPVVAPALPRFASA
jgi:nucleotide-binding universal stress UspA family protein